jgi:hypothetical protein
LAPAVGFEPTTNRLTADRSTTELRWIIFSPIERAYISLTDYCAASGESVNPDLIGLYH